MRTLLALSLLPLAVGCATLPRAHAGPCATATQAAVSVRVEAGTIWTASSAATEPHPAWRTPSHGPVDELEVHPSAGGYEVTLRQGGTRWHGRLDGHRAPVGPLAPEAERPAAASPAVAASGP